MQTETVILIVIYLRYLRWKISSSESRATTPGSGFGYTGTGYHYLAGFYMQAVGLGLGSSTTTTGNYPVILSSHISPLLQQPPSPPSRFLSPRNRSKWIHSVDNI